MKRHRKKTCLPNLEDIRIAAASCASISRLWGELYAVAPAFFREEPFNPWPTSEEGLAREVEMHRASLRECLPVLEGAANRARKTVLHSLALQPNREKCLHSSDSGTGATRNAAGDGSDSVERTVGLVRKAHAAWLKVVDAVYRLADFDSDAELFSLSLEDVNRALARYRQQCREFVRALELLLSIAKKLAAGATCPIHST